MIGNASADVQFLVQEGGRTPPPYPSLFIKPSTSLASFDATIPIPKLAQQTLDYEGELASALKVSGTCTTGLTSFRQSSSAVMRSM
jgi:2-keto-4-pentenoate hydratase/2-oxohepta-3-ene-1,7-dioic acid hydratase in catechol pathway